VSSAGGEEVSLACFFGGDEVLASTSLRLFEGLSANFALDVFDFRACVSCLVDDLGSLDGAVKSSSWDCFP